MAGLDEWGGVRIQGLHPYLAKLFRVYLVDSGESFVKICKGFLGEYMIQSCLYLGD